MNSQLSLCPWKNQNIPLFQTCSKRSFLSLFLLGFLLADHMILLYLTWAFSRGSHDFTLFYLGFLLLKPLHEKTFGFSLLGFLLLLEKFQVSFCWAFFVS